MLCDIYTNLEPSQINVLQSIIHIFRMSVIPRGHATQVLAYVLVRENIMIFILLYIKIAISSKTSKISDSSYCSIKQKVFQLDPSVCTTTLVLLQLFNYCQIMDFSPPCYLSSCPIRPSFPLRISLPNPIERVRVFQSIRQEIQRHCRLKVSIHVTII